MTEEKRAKLRENLKKANEARKAKVNDVKVTPSVTLESFNYHDEHFEKLYYEPENNIAVFRRTNPKLKYLIAYEVVNGKGKDLKYPTDNDFGKFGKCYTGDDNRCRTMIRQYHHIELPEYSET